MRSYSDSGIGRNLTARTGTPYGLKQMQNRRHHAHPHHHGISMPADCDGSM
jgi:hypothetical protein